jgi:hypothetical protein
MKVSSRNRCVDWAAFLWIGVAAPLLGLSALSNSQSKPQSAARVLADGNPSLTQSMVDQRVVVWEGFLEVKITREQHDLLQSAMVEEWEKGDKETIHDTLEDIKLYGKPNEIEAARVATQSAYVESLRKMPNQPVARELIDIYDAAHPERRDFMRAHGMGHLVGEWKRIDFMSPQTDPHNNHEVVVPFTDSLILTIFPDGHFKHFWVHGHCDSGNKCCRNYGTDVRGTVSVLGGQLVLTAASETQLSNSPCNPGANSFGAIQPHEERFRWEMRRGSNNSPALCLATQPFDPWQQGPGKAVCYQKTP